MTTLNQELQTSLKLSKTPGMPVNQILLSMGSTLAEVESLQKEHDLMQGDAVESNLAFVMLWMRSNNVLEINSSYSGGGDSGDTGDIIFDGEENSTAMMIARAHTNVTIINAELEKLDLRVFSDEVKSVKDVVRTDLTFNYVSKAGHDGFWDHDGGQGNFIIQANGTAFIKHENFSTEDVPEDTIQLTISEESVGSGLLAISNWLKQVNMHHLIVEFHGSCDEVDQYDVLVSDQDGNIADIALLASIPSVNGENVTIIEYMEIFGNEIITHTGNADYETQDNENDIDCGGGELIISDNGDCVFNMTYTYNRSEFDETEFIVNEALLNVPLALTSKKLIS